jgi:hypothetical protein
MQSLLEVSQKIEDISERVIAHLSLEQIESEQLKVGYSQFIEKRFAEHFSTTQPVHQNLENVDTLKPQFHKAYLLALIDFLNKISSIISGIPDAEKILKDSDNLQSEILEIIEQIPSEDVQYSSPSIL